MLMESGEWEFVLRVSKHALAQDSHIQMYMCFLVLDFLQFKMLRTTIKQLIIHMHAF